MASRTPTMTSSDATTEATPKRTCQTAAYDSLENLGASAFRHFFACAAIPFLVAFARSWSHALMDRCFAAAVRQTVGDAIALRKGPTCPQRRVVRYRAYRASIARSFARRPVVAAQSRRSQLGRLASLAAWRAICARMTDVACWSENAGSHSMVPPAMKKCDLHGASSTPIEGLTVARPPRSQT